jgi:hypothetical protein
LKPAIVSIATAEEHLTRKSNHWRIKNWPGPIAKFILETTAEEDVKREAIYKSEKPGQKNPKIWQFAFYRALKSAASDGQVLRRRLKNLVKVEGTDYLSGKNLFYFIRQEEFYLARNWVSIKLKEH